MPQHDSTLNPAQDFASLYAAIDRAQKTGLTDDDKPRIAAQIELANKIDDLCHQYAAGAEKRMDTYDALHTLAICLGSGIKANCIAGPAAALLTAMQMYKYMLEALVETEPKS